MAHEIRAFERSFAFASWLESFGKRVVTSAVSAGIASPQDLFRLSCLLVNIHDLPWGGPRFRGTCVWGVWSAVIDLHAALFAQEIPCSLDSHN